MYLDDYTFSDTNILAADDFMESKGINGAFIGLDVTNDRIHLNKDDVIALARNFDLNAGDL